MSAIAIVTKRRAIQYTGSNSPEIEAAVSDVTITGESGGVLSFDSDVTSWSADTGDWIVWNPDGNPNGMVLSVLSPSEFASAWDTLPEGVDPTYVASGVANVPTLALNASTTVTVTLSPAMPDSSYDVAAYLVGATGQLTITDTDVVDADTVDVDVQAGLAYVSGAQVLVLATKS